MRAIVSEGTVPELRVRAALGARGLRFVTNSRNLPGRPDIVLWEWRVVVFVDGDFWHGRKGTRPPRTNRAWWIEKIRRNRARDRRVDAELRRSGWRVVRAWGSDAERRPEAVAREVERVLWRAAFGEPFRCVVEG
jgi:DNA mismatch endonuclease, patch repair protein